MQILGVGLKDVLVPILQSEKQRKRAQRDVGMKRALVNLNNAVKNNAENTIQFKLFLFHVLM